MTNEQLQLLINTLLDQIWREVRIIENNLPDECRVKRPDFLNQETVGVPVLDDLKGLLGRTNDNIELLREGV